MLRLISALALATLLPSAAFYATTTSSHAGTAYAVTSTQDSPDANPGDGVCDDGEGNCTLRAAIMEANATAGPATIQLPAGKYTLSIPAGIEAGDDAGSLLVTDDVSIIGAGPAVTIIDAGGTDRVLHVMWTDAGPEVLIERVTLQGGSVTGSGGGIRTEAGVLTLRSSVVRENQATSSGAGIYMTDDSSVILESSDVSGNTGGGSGGGIYSTSVEALMLESSRVTGNNSGSSGGGIYLSTSGNVTINNSTISGNDASSHAGGIYVTGVGQDGLVVTNSTVSGNTSGSRGGGLYLTAGPTHVTNTTISTNSADGRGGGVYYTTGAATSFTNVTITANHGDESGGFHHTGGPDLVVRNTIIANNTPANCAGSSLTSVNGRNLDSGGTCAFGSGNITHQNPQLGPLADNGGPTLTHALLAESPAIEGGSNDHCPSIDQRGAPRPAGEACDVGAYEFGSSVPTPTPEPTPTPVPGIEQLWGDNNCNGGVDSVDALAALRNIAALSPLAQNEPCPDVGSAVGVQPAGFGDRIWADVRCDGAVDATDALAVLRFVAGLPPLTKTEPCPDVGQAVLVS